MSPPSRPVVKWLLASLVPLLLLGSAFHAVRQRLLRSGPPSPAGDHAPGFRAVTRGRRPAARTRAPARRPGIGDLAVREPAAGAEALRRPGADGDGRRSQGGRGTVTTRFLTLPRARPAHKTLLQDYITFTIALPFGDLCGTSIAVMVCLPLLRRITPVKVCTPLSVALKV